MNTAVTMDGQMNHMGDIMMNVLRHPVDKEG